MGYLGVKTIQLGSAGWIIGDLDNLLSGSLKVSIYECPNCRKLEFFRYKKPKKVK
jgi:hypothetical protein